MLLMQKWAYLALRGNPEAFSAAAGFIALEVHGTLASLSCCLRVVRLLSTCEGCHLVLSSRQRAI